MTVDGIDYNFRRAFKRFWSAAIARALDQDGRLGTRSNLVERLEDETSAD